MFQLENNSKDVPIRKQFQRCSKQKEIPKMFHLENNSKEVSNRKKNPKMFQLENNFKDVPNRKQFQIKTIPKMYQIWKPNSKDVPNMESMNLNSMFQIEKIPNKNKYKDILNIATKFQRSSK